MQHKNTWTALLAGNIVGRFGAGAVAKLGDSFLHFAAINGENQSVRIKQFPKCSVRVFP
jgi:hypothetical protein